MLNVINGSGEICMNVLTPQSFRFHCKSMQQFIISKMIDFKKKKKKMNRPGRSANYKLLRGNGNTGKVQKLLLYRNT